MKYLLAFICPPLAVALTGRIYLALFNALFWPPSLCVLALIVLKAYSAFGAEPPAIVAAVAVLSGFAALKWTSVIWLIPTIHAFFVIHGIERDKRHAELMAAQKQNALMQQGLMRQLANAAANQPKVVIVAAPQPVAIAQPKVITPKVVQPKRLPPGK